MGDAHPHPLARSERDCGDRDAVVAGKSRGGERFFEDFDRVKSLIQAHPHIGKLCDDGSRRFSFRDFRYDVFYEIGPGEIVITDIDHHHRDRKIGETGTAERRQKDAGANELEQELLALPLHLRTLLAEWLAARTEE